MSIDDTERRMGRVGAETEKVPEAAREAVGSMVKMFLKSDLTQEEVEVKMGWFLPVIGDWLKGRKEAPLVKNRSPVSVGDDWAGFLKRGRGLSFRMEGVYGGNVKLFVGQDKNNKSVIVWVGDLISGTPDNADERFDNGCREIFGEDDEVTVGTDEQTGYLSFRLKADEK